MQGYIKLHRELLEHDLWLDEKFTKGQAWVDLLLMANHKDKKVLFDSKWVVIKRGSLITSIHKLAERWKWSVNTVKKFLTILEDDEMIAKNSTNRCTLIDIVNYAKYQESQGVSNTQVDTVHDTLLDTQCAHSLTPNKNVKNEKNIKNNNIYSRVEIPYKEIVDYLNLVCGTKYKSTTKKTQDCIKARWNEGFRLDDFKQVINNKAGEWINDTKWSKFLRPETLFGNKFEGYLNQAKIKPVTRGGIEIDSDFRKQLENNEVVNFNIGG